MWLAPIAAETLVDVVNEAGLAELAVVDDVEADLSLLRDHLIHGALEDALVGGGVLLPVGAGVHEVVGPRQGADVGREDAVGAALQGSGPFCKSVESSVKYCDDNI
jgi:hypothetical protein